MLRCRARIVSAVFLTIAASTVAGCTTSWRGRPDVLAHPQAPREQIRLWVSGQAHRVHGVRVEGDSVRAVPFIRPPTCDSCAIHFGVRDIDSVQVRAFDRNMTIVVGLFAVLFLALMNAVSQLGGT